MPSSGLWDGRVPREADLCCYFFEEARDDSAWPLIECAGLLGGNTRHPGRPTARCSSDSRIHDIFFAVSNRDRILDGANVHVSMIGFDEGNETQRVLDSVAVASIHADLTAASDMVSVASLLENKGLSFQGPVKVGDFDTIQQTAKALLQVPSPNGRSNADVVRLWIRGEAINQPRRTGLYHRFSRYANTEGCCMRKRPSSTYVRRHALPFRDKSRDGRCRTAWWRLGRSGEQFRLATPGWPVTSPRVRRRSIDCSFGYHLGVFPANRHCLRPRRRLLLWRPPPAVHERAGYREQHRKIVRATPPPPASRHFPVPAAGRRHRARRRRPLTSRPGRLRPGEAPKPFAARIAAAAAKLNTLREEWLNQRTPEGNAPSEATPGAAH